MSNRRILNAEPLEYNNIQFKSKLEVMVYSTLLQEGFEVKYEPYRFDIFTGFKPTVPFYEVSKKTRLLENNSKKLINITYTPDFIIEIGDYTFIIEAKGLANDVFPIKKKLFRGWLESQDKQYVYFEVKNKRHVLQTSKIIREMVSLSNISNKIDELPKKDIPFAEKFIRERDFEALLDLVTSAIIKIKKSKKSEAHKEEYANCDIDNLNLLKQEIETYITYL